MTSSGAPNDFPSHIREGIIDDFKILGADMKTAGAQELGT